VGRGCLPGGVGEEAVEAAAAEVGGGGREGTGRAGERRAAASVRGGGRRGEEWPSGSGWEGCMRSTEHAAFNHQIKDEWTRIVGACRRAEKPAQSQGFWPV
jgi:hypothetical protein